MANDYGLDYKYFEKKLNLIVRDVKSYTPTEMARELTRLSNTADSKILLEPEFYNNNVGRNKTIDECIKQIQLCERLAETRIRLDEAIGSLVGLKAQN